MAPLQFAIEHIDLEQTKFRVCAEPRMETHGRIRTDPPMETPVNGPTTNWKGGKAH